MCVYTRDITHIYICVLYTYVCVYVCYRNKSEIFPLNQCKRFLFRTLTFDFIRSLFHCLSHTKVKILYRIHQFIFVFHLTVISSPSLFHFIRQQYIPHNSKSQRSTFVRSPENVILH